MCWGCVITAIAMRDRDGYYSGGGGGVGVDLTVLWFYGVSPWPVALSPLLPRNSRSWKSRRARLGVGGMRDGQIAVGPLAPRSHAFLPAPLALLRVFSSLGLPLPFSLFLSVSTSLPPPLLSSPPLPPPLPSLPFLAIRLSRSLLLALSLSRADTPLRTSTRSTFHLVPLLSLSF